MILCRNFLEEWTASSQLYVMNAGAVSTAARRYKPQSGMVKLNFDAGVDWLTRKKLVWGAMGGLFGSADSSLFN